MSRQAARERVRQDIFPNPQKMPALNDASGPICRSHGASLMAKEEKQNNTSQIRTSGQSGGRRAVADGEKQDARKRMLRFA